MDEKALVPRSEFESRLSSYSSLHPFEPNCLGMKNPYTGRPVHSQAEYDEYIREKLFHLICEEEYNRRKREYKKRLGGRILFGAIAVVLLLISFVFPKIQSNSYASGKEAGYSSGKTSGYTSGVDDGIKSGYSAGYEDGVNDAYSGTTKSSDAYASAISEPSSYTVYVTIYGSMYHRADCSYLKSSIPISLSDAKAQGYSPCSRCHPPE